MLYLEEPVTAEHSNQYLAVIRDARGVIHFWNHDGTYDGCDWPCEEVESA